MNNLIISNNQTLTMSSEDLADLLSLRHDNVRKAVKNLESHGVITFTTELVKGAGRPKQVMHFDKRNSIVVAAKLNDKLMAAVIDRWIELESKQPQPQIPTNFAEALQLAADQAKQLEIAAPKVAFVDNFVESTGNKTFRQVAKAIKANERLFRAFLVSEGFMYKIGKEWTAYQKHIDAGRFSCKVGEKNGHAFTECKFTPKGIEHIAGKWIVAGAV